MISMIEVYDLCEIIECEGKHVRRKDLGERVWLAKGKKADVIYYDVGNGWCEILHIIPKKVSLKEILKRIKNLKEVEI